MDYTSHCSWYITITLNIEHYIKYWCIFIAYNDPYIKY